MLPADHQFITRLEPLPPEPPKPLFTFEIVVAIAVASLIAYLLVG